MFLMGNLTFNPVLRHTPSGTSVADLRMAISENYRDKEGKEVKSTCFTDVVAWGRQAETCAEFLTKGSAVLVEGRLQFDQWDTPEGAKRSKLRVKAHRVQFLGGKWNSNHAEDSSDKDAKENFDQMDL
ncbi:MAG TPA: single-stranded DNA-binding protein [Verrucomicrobia bacterium]|nr:MAG: hypothetical protein A2X46_07795 [Lentisphaerae bacterium GWF2_57_35]HBA84649.1 single-stranded DNA-binding protein [Verrucomicrobiota bacterium]